MNGQVGIDDLLHTLAQGFGILRFHGASNLQVAVVAVRHRNVYDYCTIGIEVAHGFTQDKKERPGIGTLARCRRDVEKLHVLVAIYAESESLNLIINFGYKRLIWQIEPRPLIYIFQRTAHWHLQHGIVVAAIDVSCLLHMK